jgi:hypothetical protein
LERFGYLYAIFLEGLCMSLLGGLSGALLRRQLAAINNLQIGGVTMDEDNPGFEIWKKINLVTGIVGIVMLSVGLITGYLTIG